ncbi:ATP synthase subunit delta [Desulfamplus magnetovallimortis]|jgi:F-type H+-transporting ATPase subunit delta|uniref:ATP synthase subunit delta n=1 Tax=Desulfamplus magnetovallimortis TaxID=1246637 RepID=A0A1W1H946_9BACT|nr:ATP synthase F1 subunit delta [Desulfamplus magnetovallimortis]SLM28969.1 ATP synthase subunit delta [Desulfamplus magnetovallimortis]
MKNLSVSRRYAKALMLIGKEYGQTDQYRNELDEVVDLFDANPELEMAVINPLFDKNDRRRVLVAVLEKTELSRIVQSFVMLLFDKGRIGFLRGICDFYKQLADELKGVVHATLVSATQLSAEATEKIREGLAKRTGKDVILDVEQDPELIGGIVTRIGDLVLDGSVKTQLLNMRESLKRGEIV